MTDPTSRIYNEDDDDQLLHRLLLSGIWSVHERVRTLSILAAWSRGKLPLPAYVLYLATLHHMYVPMEAALEAHADHPLLSRLYFDHELRRLPSLENDLRFFLDPHAGPGTEGIRASPRIRAWLDATVTPATEAWRTRIEALSRAGGSDAALLLAYAYTRYLGDLSGGQILPKRLESMYYLPSADDVLEPDMTTMEDEEDANCFANGNGITFYEFRNVPDVSYFKERYRIAINQVGDDMDATLKQRVVQEAMDSFECTCDILDAMQVLVDRHVLPTPLHYVPRNPRTGQLAVLADYDRTTPPLSPHDVATTAGMGCPAIAVAAAAKAAVAAAAGGGGPTSNEPASSTLPSPTTTPTLEEPASKCPVHQWVSGVQSGPHVSHSLVALGFAVLGLAVGASVMVRS